MQEALQEVVSLKLAKLPDEPERPDQIAAVLKLFEVQARHDLEEFLCRVIEAHHGGSNGARRKFPPPIKVGSICGAICAFVPAPQTRPVCDALNTATFKDEVLVWVIMSRHLLCPPEIASHQNTRVRA